MGNDFNPGQQADYVLSPFKEEEEDALPELIKKICRWNSVLCLYWVGADDEFI